jgi:WD40 repeat protein
LIPSLAFPRGLAVSGSNLFIADANGVHKYDTSGNLITDSFTSARFDTYGLAVSGDGSHLFVAGADTIGEYDTTTGATINDTFITGLDNPYAISISGSKIYVANFGNGTNGTVGEYASDGSPINPALITGLTQLYDVADYGGKLFTVDYSDGLVGGYDDTSGAAINPSFITGLSGPLAIAVVPEPATWTLLALGAILLSVHRRRNGAYK